MLRISLSLLIAASACAAQPASVRLKEFVSAKLAGEAPRREIPSHMLVDGRRPIEKNAVRGHRMRVADREFARGIHMPAPGRIEIKLSKPAARFDAVVGVDSNDLGYYSNGGRGSVVASVTAPGAAAAKTGVLHEGTPGVPIAAKLGGATEITLSLTAEGPKGLTHQAEWDQADWGDARITFIDGSQAWLADLPVGPLAGAPAIEFPFSFRYGGRPSSELLKLWPAERRERRIDASRAERTLEFTDPATSLGVRAVAVVYDDFPVVEWTLYFKNNGAADSPILEDIQALDTAFERNREGEFLLHHGRGTPNSPTDYEPLETPLPPKSEKAIQTRGGRPTDTDLCYFNLAWPGRGVIIGLGWPGQWAARFTRDDGVVTRVHAGQQLTHFKLLAGEEVRGPLVALVFWEGDWIAGQNVWRRWMVAHNLPRPGGKLPPPQVAAGSNRYTIEMQEANEANQKQYFESYMRQGLPLNYWWMDAGWYSFETGWWNTGTWTPDPQRFPNGFKPVSDLTHSKGVKTIVWFEPERVHPGTWLYLNRPQWLLGKEKENKLLYLGNPEARRWLTDHVSELLRTQGIDLYRQDFNFEPLDIWRSNDAPDRQGITEIKHVTGYLEYWDELRRRFPSLLIDTCASGGRRNDLETLRRAVPLWRSDFAYEPAAMQQFTYGISLWIPFHGTAVNSSDPYVFRSQMTPAVALGAEPQRRDIDGPALLRYLKQWREVADLYYGDYYPLTQYSTSPGVWLAWQFAATDGSRGMVQVFRRPESPFETARFPLRGLDAGGRYVITDADSGSTAVLEGRELIEKGLPVTLERRPAAGLWSYRKQ
jgi:alpha-galactosidase